MAEVVEKGAEAPVAAATVIELLQSEHSGGFQDGDKVAGWAFGGVGAGCIAGN